MNNRSPERGPTAPGMEPPHILSEGVRRAEAVDAMEIFSNPETVTDADRLNQLIDTIDIRSEELYEPERPELVADLSTTAMVETVNNSHKVYSQLHGMVRVGDSMFGIMSTQIDSRESTPHYLVSKIVPDATERRRATIVGSIPSDGQPFHIGRNQEGQKDLDSTVSRVHCSLRIEDGKLYINDTSTNGTEVFIDPEATTETSQNYSQEQTAYRGINKYFKKIQESLRGSKPKELDQGDGKKNTLVSNINIWAPPSSDLRAYIGSEARQKEQIEQVENNEELEMQPLGNDLWEGLSELASHRGSEVALRKYNQQLETQQMQDIATRKAKMTDLSNRIAERYRQDPDWRLDKADSDKIDELKAGIAADYGEGALEQYEELAWLKKQTEETQHPYLDPEESRQTLQRILETAENQDSENQVRILRKGQSEAISDLRKGTGKEIHIHFSKKEGAVNIPVGMFASASGFESWKDGRGEGQNAGGGETSTEKLQRYASQEKETAPPVDQAAAFVLPDGRVFFHSENAHRVGAAIRRGDSHIAFRGDMNIYVLERTPYVLREDGAKNN